MFHDHAQDDERHFGELKESFLELKVGFKELKEAAIRIEKKQDEQAMALTPLTEAYNGVLFSKKFVVGLSGVVLAVGAIGAGMIWLINAAIKH